MLPCGMTLAPAHSAALARSSPTLPLLPLNGAIIDSSNLLVRLSPAFAADPTRPASGTIAAPPNVTYDNETAVWVQCGKQRLRFGPAQDARGLFHRGRLLAFYSRPEDGSYRYGYCRRHCKVLWCMRDLSTPPHSEVQLQVADGLRGARTFLNWEKNWMPFAPAALTGVATATDGGSSGGAPLDELLLSYTLEPHLVLRCASSTGQCTLVHNTSSPAAWRAGLGFVRGSAPVLRHPASGRVVGVAHNRRGSKYDHIFFELQSTPPYRVIRSSAPWRFITKCHDGDKELVQFVAGAYLQSTRSSTRNRAGDARDGGGLGEEGEDTLVLSYGASDRRSFVTSVKMVDVLKMLDEPQPPDRTLGHSPRPHTQTHARARGTRPAVEFRDMRRRSGWEIQQKGISSV